MRCPSNIVYDPNCCNTIPLIPTEYENLFSTYYSCAKTIIDPAVEEYYNAGLFGKADKAKFNIDTINDVHLLFGYLSVIYIGILEDMANDPCGKPKPVSEYYDENKIDCIKKYFICKGININSLLAVFGLDDRNAKQLFDGINFMCLEECNPQKPECDNDDEVFTVNKPI